VFNIVSEPAVPRLSEVVLAFAVGALVKASLLLSEEVMLALEEGLVVFEGLSRIRADGHRLDIVHVELLVVGILLVVRRSQVVLEDGDLDDHISATVLLPDHLLRIQVANTKPFSWLLRLADGFILEWSNISD